MEQNCHPLLSANQWTQSYSLQMMLLKIAYPLDSKPDQKPLDVSIPQKKTVETSVHQWN